MNIFKRLLCVLLVFLTLLFTSCSANHVQQAKQPVVQSSFSANAHVQHGEFEFECIIKRSDLGLQMQITAPKSLSGLVIDSNGGVTTVEQFAIKKEFAGGSFPLSSAFNELLSVFNAMHRLNDLAVTNSGGGFLYEGMAQNNFFSLYQNSSLQYTKLVIKQTNLEVQFNDFKAE